MPNLDFYATGGDLVEILEHLFESGDCRVFELYSEPGQELVEFHCTNELKDHPYFDHAPPSAQSPFLTLQLYVTDSGGPFRIERVSLDPRHCNGHTFRYCMRGAGLIQLYLGGIRQDGRIVHSHTNHISGKRAIQEALSLEDINDALSWDWKRLESFSRQ